MHRIEMHPQPKKLTDLKQILDLIGDGHNYYWKILWLEATSKDTEISIIEFEEKIRDASDGYLINWPDLVQLSDALEQTINILLIGDKEIARLRRYEAEEEMKTICAICIELVDSSYWEVYTNVDSFKEAIKQRHPQDNR